MISLHICMPCVPDQATSDGMVLHDDARIWATLALGQCASIFTMLVTEKTAQVPCNLSVRAHYTQASKGLLGAAW